MAHQSDAGDLSPVAAIDQLLAETDQGWDLEAQVRTLKQAAAATTQALPTLRISKPKRPSKEPPALRRKGPPPLPSSRATSPEEPGSRAPADMLQPGALVDLIQTRISTLEQRDDKVGLARLHMELAIATEAALGDDAKATSHAEAALALIPTLPSAHSMLRRKRHGRSALAAMLEHLENELMAATSDAHKAELYAEKARLLDALGDRGTELRTTWEQALAHVPNHAAALKGLEAELLARAQTRGAPADWEDWELLAAHLARMAEAYESDFRLAAWLHVERARILERKLGRVEAARGALERALELDSSIGPVRGALERHIAAYADWGGLARLLDEEARVEENKGRAARLELDAAAITATRLADRARGCALLERAANRAPTVAAVDKWVLDQLVRLYELEAKWADAARARRARLRLTIDPPAIAYDLRSLAAAAEAAGDLETAIADVQRALAVDFRDATLVETLDRLLKASDKPDQRIAMWVREATRTEDAVPRARALVRAAAICDELGRRADAIRHLRTAWISAPGDPEVLDALARQLAPTVAETPETGARALVDLYVQAAEATADAGRKVAFLERVGLLWEELLGNPAYAARAYEQALELEPERRSALLGLERAAARLGDADLLARALLDEARLATDENAQLSLRTRAARALAEHDPARAMQLTSEILEEDAGHVAARALETQIAEGMGRWELAAKSLRARIDLAAGPEEKVALWLALAHVQHAHLHSPLEAMASLEQAWALDPANPVPPEEIARVMEDHGDVRALCDAVERMAARAATPEERAHHLARAAEINELRLGDDAAAIRLLQRALAEAPDDDLVAERLARVVVRHAQRDGGGDLGELATLLGKRIERAPSPDAARAMSFDLAALLVEVSREPVRASSLLEEALTDRGEQAATLRLLESLRRRAGELMPLARVLDQQGERLGDVRARLGALWNLAALEEWKLPIGDPGATYRRILELDPGDPSALEAVLRRELGDARSGDPRALETCMAALRALIPLASDDETRLMLELTLGLVLEKAALQAPEARISDDLAREALGRYRDALRIDAQSVTAATGIARLAGRFRESEAALAAAQALAEIAADPRVRARYLVEGADLLLGPDEDMRLGARAERHKLAVSMLERALDADPDSIAAAGRLATALQGEQPDGAASSGERVVNNFRAALARTTSAEAAVLLGSEIARAARDELHDLTVAIDAMRRVRTTAPQHVPSLLTLAELCIAQRAWPEAVDALEAVVTAAHELTPKLTALFALASIYEKVLVRPKDADRVLRAAVAADPANARALAALLRRAATQSPEADEAAERARRTEMADLLGRLATVEKGAERKTGILMELAEVRGHLGDAKGAERALVEAVATSPSNAHAFTRLGALFLRKNGRDEIGYSRALTAVIALGQQMGAVDARWFAALGQLEIQSLSRTKDGIVHLQRAVALDPTLYETRFELGCAYERAGDNAEATRTFVAMLAPAARPLVSIAKPVAALALLEKTLSAEQRPEESLVVAELRTLAGDLEAGRVEQLRARRAPPPDSQRGRLDRPTLVTQVLPPEGRHILLEVAAAIAGIEAKLLRSELSELGIGPRDRISSRDRHPLRALLDRIARLLGLGDVELVVTPGTVRTRVLTQDDPWIVVPEAMLKLPESLRAANLARALARVAYGVPWLDELPPASIEALLIAAARQVVPGYGAEGDGAHPSALVAQYEAGLARAISRRQRKMLEELAPHIASPQSRAMQIEGFVGALVRAELRTAFLLTGDLQAMVHELRRSDEPLHRATEVPGMPALIATLEHPLGGDLVRFALTPEATALRRRLGSAWTTP
jgi:tetratricopeptide (TPR) repeat protein